MESIYKENTGDSTMQNYFYIKTIHDWNNLDQSIRAPSLETFKVKLKNNKHQHSDWFYSKDRNFRRNLKI